MTQRSVSLPRLTKQYKEKEYPLYHSPRKINKNYQKINWSIAPKCLVEGHEGYDIMYLCINQNCQEPSRLVCQTCFFKSHSKHNEEFLAIDEIKNGDIEKLRYWPFEQKFRKIFEFVTKHQSYVSTMIQDVNATFQGMATRIISSIDKIRLNFLKKIDNFYIKESVKKDFCQKAKSELQKCFELKRIRQVVRGIFTKETKHDIFQKRMSEILTNEQLLRNRQIFYGYFNKAEKGKDMHFNKMSFLKKENWIIEKIQQQQDNLQQTDVTINDDLGIEKLLPQTLAYLEKKAEGHYPLVFDKRVLEDGSEFTGFEQKGVKTLIGMRKYPSTGNIYCGEWRINAKNGYGVLQNKKTGYCYSGGWKDDKKNGYGCQKTLTSIYEGNFVGDKKEGFGILIKDGDRFEITWSNDKMHGAGKKIGKNGQQVEVYYLNGSQSKSKSSKSNVGLNLKELTKRFGSLSVSQKKAKSTISIGEFM